MAAAQQRQASLEQDVIRYEQQLSEGGYSEDQTRFFSSQFRQYQNEKVAFEEAAIAQANASRASEANLEAKFVIALRFARQYGVEAEELLGYSHPAQMERAAKAEARIQALEGTARTDRLSEVPPQQFETGNRQGIALSDEDLIASADSNAPFDVQKVSDAMRRQGIL